MFFKVNITGCQERNGLVEVRYDLYLDSTDERYSEHYVQVPVIPKEGYTGKVDEMGSPVDQADYDKWLDGLERVYQHNPFCCHFCQFEPNVSDEEIVFVGELALDMAYKNRTNLALNKNLPVKFSTDQVKIATCEAKLADVLVKDFTTVNNAELYSVRK